MKLIYLAFSVGLVVTILGLGFSFASAPRYTYLFAAIIACAILAAGCFTYVFRFGGGWRIAVLLPGIVVIYTVIDVIARAMFGARVLDMLR